MIDSCSLSPTFLPLQGYNSIGFHNPALMTPHINQLVEDGRELTRQYVSACNNTHTHTHTQCARCFHLHPPTC